MTEAHPVAFWLARFGVAADEPADLAFFAIEVLKLDDDDYFVSISKVIEPPFHEMTCFGAFANSVTACDLGRKLGFPVVEAEIDYRMDDGVGVLEIVAPFIPDGGPQGPEAPSPSATDKGRATNYESKLMVIRGVEPGAASMGERYESKGLPEDFTLTFCQSTLEPDPAQPDDAIPVDLPAFSSRRIAEVRRYGGIALELLPARQPDLLPLVSGQYEAEIWSGHVTEHDPLPGSPRTPAPEATAEAAGRCRGAEKGFRPSRLANRAYRFEDVEVLGFRIDLSDRGEEADRVLDKLIAPLNFHRNPAKGTKHRGTEGLADFRYRAASRTIVIELLRYGKMKYRTGKSGQRWSPRLGPDDYGSQHELLVRVLVGRLDDDTAQARNPAVFVPAIFVDNPISKIVGRELQGFDKQLACFCVQDAQGCFEILRPDGRLRGMGDDDPLMAVPRLKRPLTDICQVRSVSKVGRTDGHPVIDLDLESAHLDDDGFFDVDLALANRRSALSGVRWRQSDFNSAEFRRAFARPVVADGVSGTRSVQVSPVDDRGQQKLWIQGSFIATRSSLAYPSGIASLSLHGSHGMPEPWKQVQQLLGGTPECPARVDLTSGDWYRLKVALDLFVDDGLHW